MEISLCLKETFTFGMAAPAESMTFPVIVPVSAWG
jgi:hypothetical protein